MKDESGTSEDILEFLKSLSDDRVVEATSAFYWKLYKALTMRGFTNDQAIAICSGVRVGGR